MSETISTRRLVPMAFVADVRRSIEFYGKLGFEVGATNVPDGSGEPSWAWLEADGAALMVAKAGESVASEQQAVLFSLYVDDVAKAREALLAAALAPGAIRTPFYSPKGEFRLVDPDGCCLTLTHV